MSDLERVTSPGQPARIEPIVVSDESVTDTQRRRAFVGNTRISDHDAYVVDASHVSAVE